MMAIALPEWARQLAPVDMDGAAVVLGVSRRFLIDVLKEHPHYERRGAKYVFYPEHIATLREKLACPDSNSRKETVSGTPMGPSEDNAYEEALKLATRKSPKKPSRNTKRSSGNVIPMARKP